MERKKLCRFLSVASTFPGNGGGKKLVILSLDYNLSFRPDAGVQRIFFGWDTIRYAQCDNSMPKMSFAIDTLICKFH